MRNNVILDARDPTPARDTIREKPPRRQPPSSTLQLWLKQDQNRGAWAVSHEWDLWQVWELLTEHLEHACHDTPHYMQCAYCAFAPRVIAIAVPVPVS